MNNSGFPQLGETSGGSTREKVMVMERLEEGKDFHGVSPILVDKTIKSYCGEVANIKKTKDGKIFVTVKNEKQAKNLEKIVKLADGITVKVYEHKTLNQCKTVVICRDLKTEKEVDLLESLSRQGITEIKQIMKGRDENAIPTGIFVLTVNRTLAPKEVKIRYLVLQTRPWYPNPLRCFVCLKFGHLGKNCSSQKMCSKCGLQYHENCENDEKCVNCGDAHGAFYNGCPVFKKERAITRIKVDRNIPFWEARKLVDNNKPSYAESLKAAVDQQIEERIKVLNEEKKSYAEALKSDMEKQFEEKLQKYQQEMTRITNESEKRFKYMEEKYENAKAKCEQLAQAHHEEKHRRKTAEKDLENLKKSYNRLQANLSLYTSGQHKPTKHTRSQDNIASPPRKKGNKMTIVSDEIEYLNSDSENNSEDEN